MPQYRLRAAKRDQDGKPGLPLWGDVIYADDDAAAIKMARAYPVDRLIDRTDYVWLLNEAGEQVWSLKLEEALMPTGPKGQKRPADVIGNPIRVAQIATGEAREEFEVKPAKDESAAALGRKGGKARAERQSKPGRAN